MKRKTVIRALCLLVAAACLGSSAALAADGYAYLGESAGVYINGADITTDSAGSINLAPSGEISSENGNVTVTGMKMTYREIGDWASGGASGEASSGSGEASGSASGQAGQSGVAIYGESGTEVVVGGADDWFEAFDGRRYNTVIELWADDADVENALTPGSTRSALVNDVETWPGVGLEATADKLTIDNTCILTQGASRSALLTSGNTDLVVRDSSLYSLAEGWILPAHICISRAARTALLTSGGNSWFYNTRIYSDNWGTYSMDASDGIDHLYIINSYSENYRGGYGLYVLGMGEDYAQGNNHVYMYGSKFVSPQYGILFDNGPFLYVGSMADMAADEHAMDEYDGAIAPDDYLTEDGGSLIAAANNAMIVTFDMHAAPDLIGKIVMENSTLSTAAEDIVGEDGEALGHVMDYDGATVLNEDAIAGGAGWFGVNYIRGSVFWLRGANADITLDNVDMKTDTGILFQSTLDYTNNASSNMTGRECLGIDIVMKDMDVQGDILHEDYQRVMSVALDGTSLTGAVDHFSAEEYAMRAAAFVEEHWSEAEAIKASYEAENGAGSSLLGTPEDILGWLVYDETYDESLGGLEMELTNGSVWNVTGASRLTKLTIGEGCALTGMLTVNGRTIEAVPGVYEGEIVVMPLTSPSAEPSGEAS